MYSKLVLILILVGLQSGINVSAHDDAVPQLEIRRLSVTPSIVTVGGVVTVEAVLVNSGNAPVHNLLLGAAVAGKSHLSQLRFCCPVKKSSFARPCS